MDQDKKTVTVTDKDNGAKIVLAKDGMLVIKLNAQPGTGYSWRVATNEPGLLRSLGKPEFESATEGVPGQTERQVFRFKAHASGSSVLELHYVRAWEKEAAPAKTFRLQIHVE